MTSRHLAAFLFTLFASPFAGDAQVTLTGAIQFATDTNGGYVENQSWNTSGGDACWDLWLAQNPDASSPLNGPSDEQSGINIPLSVGRKYQFYMFGAPDLSISLNGLNLFFDGNNISPGISVFGPTNSSLFFPDSNSGTRTLSGEVVKGSGTSFYISSGTLVVLTEYNWNSPATPPGNVAQAFDFLPAAGGTPDFYGSFALEVFPAATLSLSQTGGPPGTRLTTTGSGFAPEETVEIYANHIGGSPIATAMSDASGAFATSDREPQTPYGSINFYAVGLRSGKLGAAPFFVSATMILSPNTGLPGGSLSATVLGFGAGETVSLYWREPQQLLGTTIANAQGTGNLKITIPANAPDGWNEVIGVGETTQANGLGNVLVK